MKNENKVVKCLSQVDFIVSSIALVILILATFIGVPMRYIMNKPFVWLEEVQSACLVWIVFGAAGAAFRAGNHVAIEMVVDRLSPAVQKIVHILITCVVIGIIGFLFVQSIGFINMFVRSGRATPILKIPYKYVYIICPVSFILQIVSNVFSLIHEWPTIGATQQKEEN